MPVYGIMACVQYRRVIADTYCPNSFAIIADLPTVAFTFPLTKRELRTSQTTFRLILALFTCIFKSRYIIIALKMVSA